MYPDNMDKTTFMVDGVNYCYKIMSFGLKNVRATYQRLMVKVFTDLIGHIMEVYVDDIIVKSSRTEDHPSHLAKVFTKVRTHNMRLNLEKYFFEVGGGKFLRFKITKKEIKVNLDKCETISTMTSLICLKEV